MSFLRKIPAGRIVVDNSRYRTMYERALGLLDNATTHDLRAALVSISEEEKATSARHDDYAHSRISAVKEAITTKLLCRGDCPKLIDSTGYRWA